MNQSTGPSRPNAKGSEVRSPRVELRPYLPGDTPALVALYNSQESESGPHSLEEFQQEVADRERGAGGEVWVAVDREVVVGYISWHRAWWTGQHDVYALELRVDRDRWGRGIGSSLFSVVLARSDVIGATQILAWIRSDLAAAQRFTAHHGFEPTGQVVEECRLYLPDARLERATDRAARLEAEGIRLVALAEVPLDEPFLRRLHRLWSVDDAANGPEFETWRSSVLDDPRLSPETHWVALDGGRPVGMTFLKRLGPDDAENDYTAVAPAYRGRGIAYALKQRAIAWGREHDMHWFYTSSLIENAPMIAINRRLGYLLGVRKVEVARHLGKRRALNR